MNSKYTMTSFCHTIMTSKHCPNIPNTVNVSKSCGEFLTYFIIQQEMSLICVVSNDISTLYILIYINI